MCTRFENYVVAKTGERLTKIQIWNGIAEELFGADSLFDSLEGPEKLKVSKRFRLRVENGVYVKIMDRL